MTVKLIALFHRKDGTTPEQFRDYYENHHAPFAASHFGHLYARYSRTYLDTAIAGGSAPDVLTEIVFHDEAAMHEMFAITKADPALGKAIAEDEARFMDRSRHQMFTSTSEAVSTLATDEIQ